MSDAENEEGGWLAIVLLLPPLNRPDGELGFFLKVLAANKTHWAGDWVGRSGEERHKESNIERRVRELDVPFNKEVIFVGECAEPEQEKKNFLSHMRTGCKTPNRKGWMMVGQDTVAALKGCKSVTELFGVGKNTSLSGGTPSAPSESSE